jgi:hypothetical protein
MDYDVGIRLDAILTKLDQMDKALTYVAEKFLKAEEGVADKKEVKK